MDTEDGQVKAWRLGNYGRDLKFKIKTSSFGKAQLLGEREVLLEGLMLAEQKGMKGLN